MILLGNLKQHDKRLKSPSAPATPPGRHAQAPARQRLDEVILVSIGRAEDVKLLQRIRAGEETSVAPDQVSRVLLECGFREEWRMQREDGLLEQIDADDFRELLKDLRAGSSPPRSSSGAPRAGEGGEFPSQLDAVLRTLRGGILAQAARQQHPWVAIREYVRQSRHRLRDATAALRGTFAAGAGGGPAGEMLRPFETLQRILNSGVLPGGGSSRSEGGEGEVRLPRVLSSSLVAPAPEPKRPPASAPARPPSGRSSRPSSGRAPPSAPSPAAPRQEYRPPPRSTSPARPHGPRSRSASASAPGADEDFESVIRTADEILAEMEGEEEKEKAEAAPPPARPLPLPRPPPSSSPGRPPPSSAPKRPASSSSAPKRPSSASSSRRTTSPPRRAASPPRRPASSSSSSPRKPRAEHEPPRFEPAAPAPFRPEPIPPPPPPAPAPPEPPRLQTEFEREDALEAVLRRAAARRVQRWWRRLRLRLAAAAKWRKRRAMLREVDRRWIESWRRDSVAKWVESHASLRAAAEGDAGNRRAAGELTTSEAVLLRWLAARAVQRVVRGWQARKRVRRRRAALLRAQAIVRGFLVRRRTAGWRAAAAARARRAARGRWRALRGELEAVAEGQDWMIGAVLAAARESDRVERAIGEEGRMLEAHFRYWDKKMTKWCLGRPFPSNWVPQMDPVSGRTSYLNLETNQSQPEHPNMRYAAANRARERAKAEHVLAERVARLASYRERVQEFARGTEAAGLASVAAASAGLWRALRAAAHAVLAPEAAPLRQPAGRGRGADPPRGGRLLVVVDALGGPIRQVRLSAATASDGALPLRAWAPIELPAPQDS